MNCKKCNEYLEEGALFCVKCGTKVELESLPISENNNKLEEKKKSKGLGFLISLVCILAVIALASVVIVVLNNKDSNAELRDITSSFNKADTNTTHNGSSLIAALTGRERKYEGTSPDVDETEAESRPTEEALTPTDTEYDMESDVFESDDMESDYLEETLEKETLEKETLVDEPVQHTYLIISEDVTWEEAYERSFAMGGHLCTITSYEEQQTIETYLREQQIDTRDSKLQIWIGASDLSYSGYQWTTGEDFSYYNWLPGEPSYEDPNSGDSENYACMYYKSDIDTWIWNDVPNDISKWWDGNISYLVEFDY